MTRNQCFCALMALTAATPALAQFDSLSDGSDGALLVFAPDHVIDLRDAPVGPWDSTPQAPGQGVYDPELWAVVFQYTTVDVLEGGSVAFINHPSGAPVIWLASSDVNIQGDIGLDGQDALDGGGCFEYRQPGPGGFAGGAPSAAGFPASGGFGPGGGGAAGDPSGAGSYATDGSSNLNATYGNVEVHPLIGGSGASGDYNGTTINALGGAGGGAILIASSGSVTIDGTVHANGGDGINAAGSADALGGSGGAVRIIANSIAGTGLIQAFGKGNTAWAGGDGRIRLEAFDVSGFLGTTDPNYTTSGPGPFLDDPDLPRVTATVIDGVDVPADPSAGVNTVDLIVSSDEVLLEIVAENVPPGTTVEVLITPAHGEPYTIPSTPLSGSYALSQAIAVVPLPSVQAEIQLRAQW